MDNLYQARPRQRPWPKSSITNGLVLLQRTPNETLDLSWRCKRNFQVVRKSMTLLRELQNMQEPGSTIMKIKAPSLNLCHRSRTAARIRHKNSFRKACRNTISCTVTTLNLQKEFSRRTILTSLNIQEWRTPALRIWKKKDGR